MRRNPEMITDYKQDLRLYRTRMSQFGLLLLALLWLLLPMQMEDAWITILNTVAVFAIGAIGLNLLSGYTGEVSLGQAFFMGMGAFTALFLGNNGWPFVPLLIVSTLVGAALGAIVGPIALRLEGNYLAIVTIGLMFLGQHLLNSWEGFSGGTTGMRSRFAMQVGPFDFNPLGSGAKVDMFGMLFSRTQARFYLLWALVALVALVAKNVVRSRPGRAMQAIRDRDIAAEVVGVSLLRYKVGAFALSSALTAFSGALFATLILGSIRPDQFGAAPGLVISIQFVAIIIVGGMGTIYGSILGALVIAGLPGLISRISSALPFLKQGSDDWGIMTAGSFSNALFGLLIIVFLLAEPLGLAGVWMRIKAYFKSWPFSY